MWFKSSASSRSPSLREFMALSSIAAAVKNDVATSLKKFNLVAISKHRALSSISCRCARDIHSRETLGLKSSISVASFLAFVVS